MIQTFYSINDAITCDTPSKTSFIIANERKKKSGDIGRSYTVFPRFKTFLENRDSYPHCHEIIVDHINNKPNVAGRLAFDIDLKECNTRDGRIPSRYTKQIELTIIAVLNRYFHDVDMSKLEFVWSTSPSDVKISKHMVVKNLYLEEWITMSKIFYRLFSIIWEESYNWIAAIDLVDSQIARPSGSLRMVGSSKIGGGKLVLDNDNHTLQDSLIRIYYRNRAAMEQLVTMDHINEGVLDMINCDARRQITMNVKGKYVTNGFIADESMTHSKCLYEKAYLMFSGVMPNIYSPGKIVRSKLRLIRRRPARCIFDTSDEDMHQHIGGYIQIFPDKDIDNRYHISFGCYRERHKDLHFYIGYLDGDTGDMSYGKKALKFMDNNN